MRRTYWIKRTNKAIRAAAFTLAALLILPVAGCGIISRIAEKAGFPARTSGGAAASESADAAIYDLPDLSEIEAMEVEVGGTPAQQPEITPSDLLGSIGFTPDETRSARGDYEPDKSLVLEVTDGGGFTWRLEIPEDAVYRTQTITMTPLRDLKSDVLGAVSSGVRLEPDGLNFLMPVMLSVEGPGVGGGTVLLSGDHGGGNLGFIPMSEGAEGVGAEIWHFSTSFTVDENGVVDNESFERAHEARLKMYRDRTKKERRAAMEAAREMLRQPITVPVPPDISYKCKADACEPDTKDLDGFLEQFLQPEKPYLEELFRTERNYQLFHYQVWNGPVTETSYQDEGFIELYHRLTYRYIKKMNELIKLYAYRPEKCMAVSKAAIRALHEHQLMGGDYNHEEIFQTLITWLTRTFDLYLDELRRGHDFKVVHALLRLARQVGTLGGPNLLEQIDRSLRFTVKFKNRLEGDGASYHLSGEIEASFDYEEGVYAGSGEGEYTSVTIPYGEMQLPNNFPVRVVIDRFDFCKAEFVEVYVDRFGAEKETYIADGYPVTTVGAVEGTTRAFLFDYAELSKMPLFGGMAYKFALPLQNGKEIIAEKTFQNSLEGFQWSYVLELWHTPK